MRQDVIADSWHEYPMDRHKESNDVANHSARFIPQLANYNARLTIRGGPRPFLF